MSSSMFIDAIKIGDNVHFLTKTALRADSENALNFPVASKSPIATKLKTSARDEDMGHTIQLFSRVGHTLLSSVFIVKTYAAAATNPVLAKTQVDEPPMTESIGNAERMEPRVLGTTNIHRKKSAAPKDLRLVTTTRTTYITAYWTTVLGMLQILHITA